MDEPKILMESESYHGKNESYGYKEIVMRQLQKVVNNMSQEMRAGHWVYGYPNPNATPQRTKYMPDTRKELVRSIDCLHDLLLSKFDEIMKTKSKEIYEEIKGLEEREDGIKKGILPIYRKLFQELCLLLERLGWLESEEVND